MDNNDDTNKKVPTATTPTGVEAKKDKRLSLISSQGRREEALIFKKDERQGEETSKKHEKHRVKFPTTTHKRTAEEVPGEFLPKVPQSHHPHEQFLGESYYETDASETEEEEAEEEFKVRSLRVPPSSPEQTSDAEKLDWTKLTTQNEEEGEEETNVVSYEKLKPFYGSLKPPETKAKDEEEEEEFIVKYGATVEETAREVQDIRQAMMTTDSEEPGEELEFEELSTAEEEEDEKEKPGRPTHGHKHRSMHRHRGGHGHKKHRSSSKKKKHGSKDRCKSGHRHQHDKKSQPTNEQDASGQCGELALQQIRDESGLDSLHENRSELIKPCIDKKKLQRKLSKAANEEGQELNDECDQFSVKDMDEMIRLLRQNNEGNDSADNDNDDDDRRISKVKSAKTQNATEDNLQDSASNAGLVVGEEEKMVVLGPNHPKMQRFQEALKAHLQKQLYLAQCESKDLQKELQSTKKEREDTGAHLYNLQYELARQTDILSKHEKQLEKMSGKKGDMELSVEEKRKTLIEAKETLKSEMAKEEALIKAMKEIDMLEWCVRQAVDEYESEITIKENIDDKINKMKDDAEVQKRSQDYYLDKLMSHVERMEQSNAGIKRQIHAHLDEQKDLSTFINEATTEIEALQIEKVHLQRAWNETLTVIRARDDAFNAASEAVKQSKEQIRHRESELRYLNCIIAKEQVKHEQAHMLLKRRKMEDLQLASQLSKLNETVEQLESGLALLQNMRAEVEGEYLKVSNELLNIKRVAQKPRRRYEKLCTQKRDLEDKILKDIQEKTAMDKIANHITKKIEKARGKTREMEFQLVKVENEMTELTAVVETLRTDVLKKSTAVEELEKKMAIQETSIQDQINDLKISEKTIQRKTNELEKMNRKLQKLLGERGDDSESGPLEKEIDELERQIISTRVQGVELQEEWLKLQDTVVSLTTNREELATSNELIRKEIFIIERKKQRVEVELVNKESQIGKLTKDIELTKAHIQRLNGKLFQNQSEQTQLGRDNVLLQNELVARLKDAELEAAELENDIESLEKEKVILNTALFEAHDQCLIWEKKVKLVKEVKESVKVEQETTTGTLKLAIHHMKVRYQELMRVQEKLMTDLEQTVGKRELIVRKSEFELQKANINPSKTKLNIQRNFKKILEENRKLLKDAKGSEIDVKNTEKRISMLEERLECDAAALKNIREVIQQAEQKLNEAVITKHKNLIELILRQKKYKILESINTCRYKPSWKGIENINHHIEESEKRCYAIAELCDVLMNEFPENSLEIKLIKASIFSHVK